MVPEHAVSVSSTTPELISPERQEGLRLLAGAIEGGFKQSDYAPHGYDRGLVLVVARGPERRIEKALQDALAYAKCEGDVYPAQPNHPHNITGGYEYQVRLKAQQDADKVQAAIEKLPPQAACVLR